MGNIFRMVDRETLSKMFRSGNEVSSTRVMAYLVWVFAKWWMVIFGIAFLVVYVMDTFGLNQVDDATMEVMIRFFSWSVIILLTAAFAPKAFSKVFESGGLFGVFTKKKNDES